jgi:hypothetical protein
MTMCDTCLAILRGGLRSARHKEEWLREYDLHLALAHGIRSGVQVSTPATRELLREFWKKFRLPGKQETKTHRLSQV